MALSTQPYKGARDFYPEDKRIQNYIFGKLRESVQSYGYEEYDAPILEPLELYQAKSGSEIVNDQTYTFEDRGGRKVAMRPEMTPTVSRMVAGRRQELPYPLRWYSIPNLWRYERPQRGRLREHWQLNVDIFGVSDIQAEREIIMVADTILKNFGAKPEMYRIKLNSRKFIDYVLDEYLGLDQTQAYAVVKLIDRMHKMDYADFASQLDILCTPMQRERKAPEKLLEVLAANRINLLPPDVKAHSSIKELQDMIDILEESGVENVEFDVSIMRGFDYYTDIVFEVFDNHPDNNRSMFGGGRYDGLVGLFGVEPVPTVGFGMGDVTLQNFLEIHGLLPAQDPTTDIYVVFAGDLFEASRGVISELRDGGLNVAVDLGDRKLDKQFKTADKLGVRYVLVVGETELKEGNFKLKNLRTGAEESHSIARIVSIVKDYRHSNHGDI